MAAVDAKALADYGTDRFGMRFPVHLTAWGYGQMSSLLSYLMAPLIKLFGLNPVVARLPQLIISLLGLLTLYFFSRDAFGKTAALVIFAFGAINPWHILQSRWALDCNLYPHFFLFGLYFLHRAMQGKKRLWLCVSMGLFGLCMYCYGIAIYTLPVFLVLACVYLLVKKRVRMGDALLALAVWLAVAWPFILVMAINFFRWDTIETPLFTLPYFAGSVRSGDILFFSENIPAQLWQNMKALADAVIIQKPDLPWNSIGQFGSLYLFSLPFAIAGLVWLLKRLKTSDGAVLLLLFFVTGVWCGLCTNNVNINRVNIIFYPMLCFTGLGLYAVGRCVRVRFLRPGLAAGYLLAFCLFCGCYFGPYAQQIEGYFLKDFGDAVASLKDSPAEKLYITGKSQGENTDYVSQVLTLFYHETDAEYFQGKRQLPGLLPFRERYTFANMEQLVIDPQENAAYVAAEEDLKFFELDAYEMERYGSYYVLRTKGE
ncbi:MAG: glycosyltransferase family 39 protein [Oscillospiraceae bacterium]|nr:glycosyltransferase family 39 protein [Oscillospiraceae bacterium]